MEDTVGNLRFVRGANLLLGTATFQDQFEAVFAGLAKGSFVATWTGEDGFNDFGVRAQLFDTNGRPVGSEFAVNDHTAGVQAEPSATALAGGGFVITWSDETAYPNTFDIRAQIYDPAGAPVGSAFTVNTTLPGFQTQSKVSSLADGGFAVAWEQGNDASGDDVRTRVFNADGTPVGGERIVIGRPGDVSLDDLAALTGGGYVVTWSDYGAAQDENGNLLPGSRAQLLDAAGQPVGNPFVLEDFEPGTQSQSRVAGLLGGGFVAVWSDDGSDFGDPTHHAGFWVQAFDAAGGRVGDSVRVTDYPGIPDIDTLPDGTIVLTWTGGFNSGHTNLQAQLLDSGGHLLGGAFEVNPGTTSKEGYASVAALSDGSFVIGWADTPAPQYNDSDVHARVFDPITRGSDDADAIVGTHAQNFFAGLGGNDTIGGAGGDDWLAGGDGRDFLAGGRVVIDSMATPGVTCSMEDMARMYSMEDVARMRLRAEPASTR